MKAKEVLGLLKIARQTLVRYVREGKIKVKTKPNGQYEYDETSVYAFLNQGVPRKICIYARVSTPKQKSDLETQIEMLKSYCFMNGMKLNAIHKDIASGISFSKRDDFFKLLDEIIDGKVSTVVISYKDRLSRVGFELFSKLFDKFGTKIVVVSEVGNEKLDSQEIFEEIVSLLHCYSMKLYSSRKKKTIKDLISK
jgi:predicted site-specific integrase-resolvase